MSETNYRPNSHKYKEEQNDAKKKPALEKVVRGPVKVKKKNGLHKFADNLISEDAGNVGSYIFSDVLIPAAKKLVIDIVTDGINMLLNGGTGRSGRSTNAPYVSYRSFSDRRDDRRPTDTRTRSRYSYEDLGFRSRGEAEEVLRRMDEIVDTYRMVSVADLYDLAGVSGEHTDNKYGWTDISSARVVRTMDGDYVIKLPRALPID